MSDIPQEQINAWAASDEEAKDAALTAMAEHAGNAHTPGPWRYSPGSGVVKTVDAVPTVVVARYVDAHNAHLMAAAPEMYAVLKWISSQQNLFFAECSQAEEIIARSAAAIAKAEGR